ncbi:hypothetical protein Plhal304r1_c068g0156301 [Plasmopara halstedii]
MCSWLHSSRLVVQLFRSDRQYALTFLHRGYTEKPCVVEFVLTKSQRIISQPSLGS